MATSKKPFRSKSKTNKEPLQQGSYRIIGGQWRSRRLQFPATEGLRPTTDRVRETVFNWLANHLPGARVLDLFCGSGALGFEALSRGASRLLAIEKNPQVVRALKANIELLQSHDKDAKSVTIQGTDAIDFLKSTSSGCMETFDVLFIDPPFRQEFLEALLVLLDGHPMIEEGALIYMEREKEKASLVVPKTWTLLKEKTAGQVLYQLYQVDKNVSGIH